MRLFLPTFLFHLILFLSSQVCECMFLVRESEPYAPNCSHCWIQISHFRSSSIYSPHHDVTNPLIPPPSPPPSPLLPNNRPTNPRLRHRPHSPTQRRRRLVLLLQRRHRPTPLQLPMQHRDPATLCRIPHRGPNLHRKGLPD